MPDHSVDHWLGHFAPGVSPLSRWQMARDGRFPDKLTPRLGPPGAESSGRLGSGFHATGSGVCVILQLCRDAARVVSSSSRFNPLSTLRTDF